jgi:hypothetical protein
LAAQNVTLLPEGVTWDEKTLATAPAEMQNILAPCVIWPERDFT